MVKYNKALVRSLEKILRSSFNQPTLILSTPTKLGTGFHVRLAGTSRTAHMDDGPDQEVAEIIVNHRGSDFWFSFDAAFVTLALADQYELQDVGVGVFHNIAGELVPLFRADWHRLDALGTSVHAQPHWHFVQRPARIEGIIRTLESSTPEAVREFAPDPQTTLFGGVVDCGMIHFAMTSLWERAENQSYTKRIFNSEDFPKWFQNLAQYIAGQIALLVRHTPIEDAPFVKEFTS